MNRGKACGPFTCWHPAHARVPGWNNVHPNHVNISNKTPWKHRFPNRKKCALCWKMDCCCDLSSLFTVRAQTPIVHTRTIAHIYQRATCTVKRLQLQDYRGYQQILQNHSASPTSHRKQNTRLTLKSYQIDETFRNVPFSGQLVPWTHWLDLVFIGHKHWWIKACPDPEWIQIYWLHCTKSTTQQTTTNSWSRSTCTLLCLGHKRGVQVSFWHFVFVRLLLKTSSQVVRPENSTCNLLKLTSQGCDSRKYHVCKAALAWKVLEFNCSFIECFSASKQNQNKMARVTSRQVTWSAASSDWRARRTVQLVLSLSSRDSRLLSRFCMGRDTQRPVTKPTTEMCDSSLEQTFRMSKWRTLWNPGIPNERVRSTFADLSSLSARRK